MESSYFEKSIQPLVETTNISLQPEQDIYQAMERLGKTKHLFSTFSTTYLSNFSQET